MPIGFFIDAAFSLMLTGLIIFGFLSLLAWRSLSAKRLWLDHCDVAIRFPEFASPEGRLDMRERMVGGDKTAFEQYEWYVARLVYVLDECLKLGPSRWRKVADTQLDEHKHYFASDYYAKQDYLPHYSARMKALIRSCGKGA